MLLARLSRRAFQAGLALAMCGGCAAFAAEPPQAQAVSGDSIRMQWVDLRRIELSDTAAFTRLWQDRLAFAQAKWQSPGQSGAGTGKPFPAFTLSHTFTSASPPVLVSILFDLYDCELPGNGAGSDLFARCPMRVVTGTPGATRVKTIERVCQLYVPPIAKPGDGPDPAKNFTSVTLDASRTLHLRVVQFGRPVAACDGDYALE